ncbi:MAG: hypothetical protein QW815_07795 [Nitrososphaerota archaeon]
MVEKEELKELYSRFGWKWVALASMAGRLISRGEELPEDVIKDLRLARTKLESGCYSVCDVMASLRSLEIKLFDRLLKIDEGEVQRLLELLGKAMSGTLREEDVNLSAIKTVLADCRIPSVCQEAHR